MTDQPVKKKGKKRKWLILVGALLGAVEIAAQTGLLPQPVSDLVLEVGDAALAAAGL